MKTEIEAKFLDVDFNLLREKLKQLDGIYEWPIPAISVQKRTKV